MIIIILLIVLIIVLTLILDRYEHFNFNINDWKSNKNPESLHTNDGDLLQYTINKEVNNNGISYNNSNKLQSSYTLSFLLKANTYDPENAYTIVKHGNYKVQIKNNGLALILTNEDKDKTYFYDNIFSKDDQELTSLQKLSGQRDDFYHFALVVDDKDTNIKVFLNGFRGNENYTNKLFKQEDILSIASDYIGTIVDIGIYNDIYNKNELCDMHGSCGDISCPFISKGKTRDECHQMCIDSGCSSLECDNKCYSSSMSSWKKPCNFKSPSGITLNDCIKTCTNEDNCNWLDCSEICNSCDNELKCLWIKKKISDKQYSDFESLSQTYQRNFNDNEPLPPIIKVTTNEGQVTLKWKMPPSFSEGQINYETRNNLFYNQNGGFIFTYYKTNKKHEGVNIGIILESNLDNQALIDNSKEKMILTSKDENPIMEYTIKGLDSRDFYTISLKAFNKDKNNKRNISISSNSVTFIPKKSYKIKSNTIRNSKIEHEKEYYSFCDL
jgi:hypothetical protein